MRKMDQAYHTSSGRSKEGVDDYLGESKPNQKSYLIFLAPKCILLFWNQRRIRRILSP